MDVQNLLSGKWVRNEKIGFAAGASSRNSPSHLRHVRRYAGEHHARRKRSGHSRLPGLPEVGRRSKPPSIPRTGEGWRFAVKSAPLGAREGKTSISMIEKIKITNFRCFKQLELSHLRRFNVLVGPSGSGKTALLEAIFLAGAGSAEAYLRIRKWRGLPGPISFTGSTASYESLFREIFFGFNAGTGARVELVDSEIGSRRFSVGLKGEMEFRVSLKRARRQCILGRTNSFSMEDIWWRSRRECYRNQGWPISYSWQHRRISSMAHFTSGS